MKDVGDKGEIIIYQSADGATGIEVKVQDETVWLTQILTQNGKKDMETTVRRGLKREAFGVEKAGNRQNARNCKQAVAHNRSAAGSSPFSSADSVKSLDACRRHAATPQPETAGSECFQRFIFGHFVLRFLK